MGNKWNISTDASEPMQIIIALSREAVTLKLLIQCKLPSFRIYIFTVSAIKPLIGVPSSKKNVKCLRNVTRDYFLFTMAYIRYNQRLSNSF